MDILVNMVHSFGVDQTGSPLHPVNQVTFVQQELSEVGTILARDSRNQSDFLTHSFLFSDVF